MNTHNYTVVLSSVNESDTDGKCLLKTSAVRFFGTLAEVELCPFVSTSGARHTYVIIIIMLSELSVVFFFGFSQLYFLILFCFQGNIFSLFSLSLSLPLFSCDL